MTAITTACFGGYDILRPQAPQDSRVEWVAFCDRPTDVPDPWRVVLVDPGEMHPRMGAKWYRMHDHGLGPDVVWIDANMEVTSPSFAREALASRRNGIAVWQHPNRDCIYDEAEASIRLCPVKYAGQPITEQAAAYRAEGHPEHAGLYANGTIAWDWAHPAITEIAEAWWLECLRWTYQDQISLPVVLRRAGVTPGVFPYRQIEQSRPLIANRWLCLHDHLSNA